MPPDIIAGLIALTGPPGAASTGKAAELPASRTISAAVFAALLTQNSPPNVKLAAPKADAVPTVKLGSAAKQQVSKEPKTLSILKTMDTLPPPFSSPGTALQASELPLLNMPSHQSPADDRKTDDRKTDAAKASAVAPGVAAAVLNSTPSVMPFAIPAVPAEAALLPASAPAPAVSAPASSVSAAPAQPLLTAQKTLSAVLPAPTAAAALPAARLTSAPSPALSSVPLSLTPAASLVRLQAAPATEPAAGGSPAPSRVALPRSWPLPALASAESLPPVLPQAELPVAPLTAAAAPEPAKPAASGVPAASQAVPAAIESVKVVPLAAAHAAPQAQVLLQAKVSLQGQVPLQAQVSLQAPVGSPGAVLPQIPSPASPALSTEPASAAPLIAASVLAEPATAPPVAPAPAKSAGRPGQIALKPAPQNADINTRTLPSEAPAAAGKTVASAAVSAKATAPTSDSQSQAPSSKKPPEPGSELASDTPLGVQTALPGAQEANSGSKPLSAADHAAMVRQVADGVGAMPLPAKPGNGVQQMSLQLHPKDWGSLQVSVAVTPGQEPGAAKTVTAHIVAETPQVKAALQSQSGALHQALRASGLNLEHLTVSVKPAAETVKSAAETVKPSAQSASTGFSGGFSGGQGQPSSGSSSAHPAPAASNSPPAGTQLGTSAGSSQNGRQGQPPVFTSGTALAEPAPEEIAPVRQTMRLSSRIDTHA